MGISYDELGYKKVSTDDYFNFECSGCGDCCRNIKSSVLVESLDLFSLARFFNMEMCDVALKYTDTVFLAWGFPAFMLKTKQYLDTCVFLQASRCSVHRAKPRACRTYPLGIGPDDEKPGEWLNFIVSKDRRHFKGKRWLVRDWLDENLTPEDRAFVSAEYINTGELARLMKKIDKRHEDRVLELMLFFKYTAFDVTEDFSHQYARNMEQLKKQLARLVRN